MCVRYAKLATAADIVCVMYQKLNNNKNWPCFLVLPMRDMKCPCVCRRTKVPGRGVHSEKVREIENESEKL